MKISLQIILEHGKNQVNFTGRNYCFLSKAYDMLTLGNVTINRAAHEGEILIHHLIHILHFTLFIIFRFINFLDLSRTKWFGLITNVVVTKIFELHIIKDIHERILYIGDNEHTILFKYEIYEIDENGTVINSVNSCVDFIIELIAERILQIYFILIGNEENTL